MSVQRAVSRVTVVVQGTQIEDGVFKDRGETDPGSPPLAVGELRFDAPVVFQEASPIVVTLSTNIDGRRVDLFNAAITWRE